MAVWRAEGEWSLLSLSLSLSLLHLSPLFLSHSRTPTTPNLRAKPPLPRLRLAVFAEGKQDAGVVVEGGSPL
jgi:hypothetical protein